MSTPTTKRTLTLQLEEGAKDVLASLAIPEVGVSEQRIALDILVPSLSEWLQAGAEDAVADARVDSLNRILTAIRDVSKWQLNALGTPMRYALLLEGEWKVAIATRLATDMVLKYDDGEEEPRELAFRVPPHVLISVWRNNQLHSGSVALVARPEDLPVAPNDLLHPVTPWVWGNVFDGGHVCWGSTTRPHWGQDGITPVERTFFDSLFNADITRYRRLREDEEDPEDRDDERPTYYTLASYHDRYGESDSTLVQLPVTNDSTLKRTLFFILEALVRTAR
jgi:hypothetical protein